MKAYLMWLRNIGSISGASLGLYDYGLCWGDIGRGFITYTKYI